MTLSTSLLRSSKRVSLDEFGSEFSAAWKQVKWRFLKLECWQRYQENRANESQEAYDHGDIARARELLEAEAQADRPLYEDIARHGIDYARIRLVRRPLTPYLQYELLAYEIRARMGENIEVVEFSHDIKLPNDRYFDFLLFDRRTALIHDYGSGDAGLQSGGWVTHDAGVIAVLESRAITLRQKAVPLGSFINVK
jgi:hypothetical protein